VPPQNVAVNLYMKSTRQCSVIIPTRNEAATIGETLRQYTALIDVVDLEIIISDANSTDQTAEIVAAWICQFGDRIQLVQKPGRQNIAIGRNAGAAAACGTILFHTDADVRLPEPALFFQTIAQHFADPRIAAATAPIRIYPEEANFTDRFYHLLMNTTIQWSIPLHWCLAKGECQIVRRSAFEQIGGYDERLVAGEDCNLFYRLQKAGKMLFLNNLVVHHSPRRFRQYGYWKVSYQYFMEGVSRLLVKKSFAREWKVVR
jgi:glycosyltransferase involved in cell wall biosynthesis